MAFNSTLYSLWLYLLPLLAVLFPIWLGIRYGRSAKKMATEIPSEPVGTAVAATLGLLGFMLAFTFQIVSNRFEQRRELLLNEVSDIRSTYLYAGLIPEQFRTNVRKQLSEYVDIRVELAHDPGKLNNVQYRSQQILDSLWSVAEALAVQDRSSEAYSLFTGSANNLARLYNERVTVALQYHMPPVVLYLLAFIAFFSMITFGYQFGITGRVNFPIIFMLAMSFAAVMWLVFALDQPEAGIIKVNQAPLYTLQEQLHRALIKQ